MAFLILKKETRQWYVGLWWIILLSIKKIVAENLIKISKHADYSVFESQFGFHLTDFLPPNKRCNAKYNNLNHVLTFWFMFRKNDNLPESLAHLVCF
jgi:hypothetical protein